MTDFQDQFNAYNAYTTAANNMVPGLKAYYDKCIGEGLPPDTATAMVVNLQTLIVSGAIQKHREAKRDK